MVVLGMSETHHSLLYSSSSGRRQLCFLFFHNVCLIDIFVASDPERPGGCVAFNKDRKVTHGEGGLLGNVPT